MWASAPGSQGNRHHSIQDDHSTEWISEEHLSGRKVHRNCLKPELLFDRSRSRRVACVVSMPGQDVA